jgi:hypothetical protein
MPSPKKSRLRMVGHSLFLVSILVWAPYYYLKITKQQVEVIDYLPFHLAGVLSGTVISGIGYFLERKGEADTDIHDIPI